MVTPPDLACQPVRRPFACSADNPGRAMATRRLPSGSTRFRQSAFGRGEPAFSPLIQGGSTGVGRRTGPGIVSEQPDPKASAREAALSYVHPDQLAITRRRNGAGFSYRLDDHDLIRDSTTLSRIRSLAVPPAWRNIRISERPDAHLQATGYDARGRRQYRYHPRYREVRDSAKFEHLIAFAERLPAVRRRVERDIAGPGLGRERVLATVVRLLEATLIRVGGAEYARTNGSFGVASLRARHVDVRSDALRFHFKGKGGKDWRVGVSDRRLARIVRACQELPGQALFQYVDQAGERREVTSTDVNAYLREAAGDDATAKDFRTWFGTVLAALALERAPAPKTTAEGKRVLNAAIEVVAQQLGNTPAICLKCYVHPRVVDAYLAGRLDLKAGKPIAGLTAGESRVLRFLRSPARERK